MNFERQISSFLRWILAKIRRIGGVRKRSKQHSGSRGQLGRSHSWTFGS